MFAAKWLERGLGQIVAPDENYNPQPEEFEQSFFANMAPFPKHKSSRPPRNVPPMTAFLPMQQQSPQTPPRLDDEPAVDDPLDAVRTLVLEAVTVTAQKIILPSAARKSERTLLEYCCHVPSSSSSSHPNPRVRDKQDKKRRRMTDLLSKNPSLLTQTRAWKMGVSPPDGHTPLMAAAAVGHVGAVELLLQSASHDEAVVSAVLQQRDCWGRTALHLAAANGKDNVVDFLKPYYQTYEPVLDLNGHTPYAAAFTSPEPAAIKTRSRLFSPDDASILGSPHPKQLRWKTVAQQQLVAVHADKPGHRITMEDAILVQPVTTQEQQVVLLTAVCDGHGDGGRVSTFVTEQLAKLVREETNMEQFISTKWWTQTCLTVDSKLKETCMLGGSTAVIALITTDHIVVANIGDSRCILVQSGAGPDNNDNDDDESPPEASNQQTLDATAPDATSTTDDTDNNNDQPPKEHPANQQQDDDDNPIPELAQLSMQDSVDQSATNSQCNVVSLTHDHKPELPEEQQRIEQAGLTVVTETFSTSDNTTQTIHKVALSTEERLATSRAFGDFEYKANKELPADQQAVIAIPDVVVRPRQPDRDQYLILACDGIWDARTNDQVGAFVAQKAATCSREKDLVQVADSLLDDCLEGGSQDNLSVVVIAMNEASSSFRESLPARKALDFSSVALHS